MKKQNGRIQIVARINPNLRKLMTRAARQKKTTLNNLIESAIAAYLGAPAPESK